MRARSSPEVESALSRVRIFSSLRRPDVRQLASACMMRRYESGQAILEEGSTGLGLFLITAGRVEVFKTLDGRKVPLAVLGEGDVLGEMALLDDQPRSASAAALEDTECLLLSRASFRSLLKRRPRIAWPIVPSLARRIRDLQEQLLDEVLDARERPLPALPAVEAETAVVLAPLPPEAEPNDHLTVAEEAAPGGPDGSRTDVLRAPYALTMASAVGFGESVRLFEVFFRSLDEESGLSSGRPMSDVVRDLPASFAAAGRSSWDQGRRVPSRLLDTFREHLRADWRDPDDQ